VKRHRTEVNKALAAAPPDERAQRAEQQSDGGAVLDAAEAHLTEANRPTTPLRFSYWLLPSINPKWASLLQREDVVLRMKARGKAIPEVCVSTGEQGEFSKLPPALMWQAAVLAKDRLALDRATHQALSDNHRQSFENGDEQALFDYMETDRCAFRELWVVRALEAWHARGEREKLERVMAGYARNKAPQPQTAPQSLHAVCDLIKRDQAAFRQLLVHRAGQAVEAASAVVADQQRYWSRTGPLGEKSIGILWDHYWPPYDTIVNYLKVATEDEFFAELNAMVERLDPIDLAI